MQHLFYLVRSGGRSELTAPSILLSSFSTENKTSHEKKLAEEFSVFGRLLDFVCLVFFVVGFVVGWLLFFFSMQLNLILNVS